MKNEGFTLTEVAVSVAVVLVLATMGIAASGRAAESARSVDCLGNLRQWGTALAMFLQDHDGAIPRRGQGVRPVEIIDRPDDWFNALPPYLGSATYADLAQQGRAPKARELSVFVCREAEDLGKPNFLAYGMNMYLSPWIRPTMHRLQEIPNPAQLAFLADGPGGWSSTIPSSQAYSVTARHRGAANVLFVDGHVETFRGNYLGCGKGNRSLPDIRWETETGGINQTHMP